MKKDDRKAYVLIILVAFAAAYAKHFKKQAIGRGAILGAHTAINCLRKL